MLLPNLRPPTACASPGCEGFAVEGRSLCAKCAEKKNEVAPHDYHKEWHRLYNNKRWRDLRAAILRRDPICTICCRVASTVADHKIDHRGDLKLFYDPNNLRGVCKPCHDERTGSEHGKGDRTPQAPFMQDGCIRDFPLF